MLDQACKTIPPEASENSPIPMLLQLLVANKEDIALTIDQDGNLKDMVDVFVARIKDEIAAYYADDQAQK
jgi:hypothetical protein